MPSLPTVILGYFMKGSKNSCPQQDLYKKVYAVFIHNNKNIKISKPNIHPHKNK